MAVLVQPVAVGSCSKGGLPATHQPAALLPHLHQRPARLAGAGHTQEGRAPGGVAVGAVLVCAHSRRAAVHRGCKAGGALAKWGSQHWARAARAQRHTPTAAGSTHSPAGQVVACTTARLPPARSEAVWHLPALTALKHVPTAPPTGARSLQGSRVVVIPCRGASSGRHWWGWRRLQRSRGAAS